MAQEPEDRPRGGAPARREVADHQRLASRAPQPDDLLSAAPFAMGASRLPMPEFLSLTYTLPFHLVSQLDRLGQLTNRSQSELVAESIRLYLKAYVARREHTRISTVEGFSYQQVAVAEAGIADEWPDSQQEPAGHEPDRTPAPPVPGEAAAAERATTEPAVVVAPPSPQPVGTPPASEPVEPEAASTASPSSLTTPEDTTGAPASATTAPAPDPEPALQFPSSVSLALEQLDATEQIADPAAEVRRRLRKLADEPRESIRLRAALEDIMRDVDVKDFSLSNHSLSVAGLAKRLAEAKGISGVPLDDIWLAGLLHDIGKASIPDDILQKRRPSPEEMSVIRQYPQFGADLLSLIPALHPAAALVATHQERWNGSGYPDGLQGNDIPLGAQIVALCDVYQVLTTARRYRAAYDEERARQIIQESAGSLWSPELVRLFLHQVIATERMV